MDSQVKPRFPDRRVERRFDVVGELWGTLDIVVRLVLEDIGPGGAMFHSQVALTPGTRHQLTLRGPDREFTTQVAVRHVRALSGADGLPSFAIGVEFPAMESAMVRQIRQWAGYPATGDLAEV